MLCHPQKGEENIYIYIYIFFFFVVVVVFVFVLTDGKINKTKQTVTPFCMFTLCEACLCKLSLSEVFSSLVNLAVPPTGGKKRGGGGVLRN